MKRLKLSTITKRHLAKINEVYPVDVEDRTQELIDDCFPKIKILDKYEYSQGSLIRRMDEVLFRQCCLDNEDAMVRDNLWMRIGRDVYDTEEIIGAFEDAGIEVENDL